MPVTKTFDAVETKRTAQKLLLAEYEARKGEFTSYADFIRYVARNAKEKRERGDLHARGADRR